MEADIRSDSGENNDGAFSFEDSDRFDEMSLCSWVSDPESICGDWRGWKRSGSNNEPFPSKSSQQNVEKLIELCSKVVAVSVSFENVEKSCPNLPEFLQLRIAFWSFPRSDDNIRLYSCLANGSAEEFSKGEQLYRAKAVVEPLQIGFHLNGSVLPYNHGMVAANSNIEQAHSHKPAVVFDRGHVTSCMCTCSPSAAWCCHIVALCLHRIYQPQSVALRPPVSESLSRLQRNQLQKFSQYLISELPQQLLPYAQKLLDELLLSSDSEINTAPGAPDPTAGPSAENRNQWWMDEKALRDNVRKMLSKFCGPGPFVLEEAYNLQFASTAPPTAAEWSNLLRPLTSHDPEGMWNLLSIVRELFQHGDSNAVELLQLLTQECLSFEQIVVWWFNSRSQNSGRRQSFKKDDNNYKSNINTASTEMTKHACASFCDELVVLWRLACLDPMLTSSERMQLKKRLEQWHTKTIEKVKNARYLGEQIFAFGRAIENFPGFKIAIEACSVDWSYVMLPSQTSQSSPRQILSEDISGHTSNAQYEMKCIEELDEDIHTLCTRAEVLQVHGYPEGSQIAEYVAEKILTDASQTNDVANNCERRAEDANCFIKTSVVQASFLCSVLYQDPRKHHLAFKIGVHGLEVPRRPATSKALEVKLTNQETELVSLLNKLPLGPEEFQVVRERAQSLCQEKLEQGKTVLPIKLAIFLFQVLTKSSETSEADKELGFRTGLTALNMKADILEVEYPMLCEGMRRQRGELALALLDYAKDNAIYLQQVKECLLDKKRYGLEAHFNGNRRSGSNQKRKASVRGRTCGNRRGRFGQSGKRQSSSNDGDRSRSFSEDKPTTSKSSSSSNVKLSALTDSSGSRQSSWSSCFSDDLSPQDEFRAKRAADSGRDSDNDTHYPVGHSSRDNYSEGEISAEHSPGEEVPAGRLERGNSGLIGAVGGNSGSSRSSETLHEGTSNVPIDIPQDDSRNPIAQNDSVNSISQNDVKGESRIQNGSNLNNVPRNEAQNRVLQDDDGWIESDGWNESHNLIPENDSENNMPQNANRENSDRKFRQNERCDQGRKPKRNKKKGRSYHDNRSLEAEAHFTFELAKKVLMLAGGATPSPNSIFGQAEPTNNVTQSICNRSLQLCAFELGLFALGLHNTTCFNWLSRTYSAHVSWISTQALELGNVALNILLEKWEGHLTPSEVASISDRASKSNDQVTIQKAAQLALACLPNAHTLNPGYIRSCLVQCKEQGTELLEQACSAVESAAKDGGVYPEVLFEVAKHWEYLYEQSQPQENEQRLSSRRGSQESRGSRDSRDNDSRGTQEDRESDESNDTRGAQDSRDSHEIQEPHEGHGEDEPRPRPGTYPPLQSPILRMTRMGLSPHHAQAMPYSYNRNYGLFIPLPTPEQLVQQQISQQVQHLIESYHGGWGQPQVAYQLTNAYQVGMLALENVGRRPADDQPNSLLAKNPPYKAEIHWLCSIANKVGISALQQFCRACVNSIHSPFVLHELALEAAGLMAKSNPSQIAFHLRSPSLSPMVQKCLMNYAQCVQQSLQNLPKSEYPEFVEMIMHARGAYCMAPGGMTQFNDLLQNIRRNTSKKKDLWQKITTGLAHQQK